jgi:hypothetical protein
MLATDEIACRASSQRRSARGNSASRDCRADAHFRYDARRIERALSSSATLGVEHRLERSSARRFDLEQPRRYACSARIRESDVHRKSDDFSRERNGVYRAVPRRNQMLGLEK